jgi:hypothetical protein
MSPRIARKVRPFSSYVGLITFQRVPLSGDLLTPVIDAAVSAFGDAVLQLQLEVPSGAASPDDEGVLLEQRRGGDFADQHTVLDPPIDGVAVPSGEGASVEMRSKPLSSRCPCSGKVWAAGLRTPADKKIKQLRARREEGRIFRMGFSAKARRPDSPEASARPAQKRNASGRLHFLH